MHCRVFSSVSGLCLLDASNIHTSVTTQNVFRCCNMSSGTEDKGVGGVKDEAWEVWYGQLCIW